MLKSQRPVAMLQEVFAQLTISSETIINCGIPYGKSSRSYCRYGRFYGITDLQIRVLCQLWDAGCNERTGLLHSGDVPSCFSSSSSVLNRSLMMY